MMPRTEPRSSILLGKLSYRPTAIAFCFAFCFETGSCSVCLAGLELAVSLHLPSKLTALHLPDMNTFLILRHSTHKNVSLTSTPNNIKWNRPKVIRVPGVISSKRKLAKKKKNANTSCAEFVYCDSMRQCTGHQS